MLKRIFRNDFPLFVPMVMIMLSAYHLFGSALSLRLILPIDPSYSNSLFAITHTNPLVMVYLTGLLLADFVIVMLGILIIAYREKQPKQ